MFKVIAPLSAIISIRFFGLFIVLPVLSAYALDLEGANELNVGLTLGAYAFSQMLLQIPFGTLSDKIGRKITIFIGFLILLAGSVVCYFSTDIYSMIFGRLLQGAGAVGAVSMALLSDLVKEEYRSRAMAFMGMSVALSFAISMALGPILSGIYGIQSLFLITAVLSVVTIIILFTLVPTPAKITHEHEKVTILELLKNPDLAILNLTSLLQKSFMTLAFLVIPFALIGKMDFNKAELWKIYIPAMIIGIFAMGFGAVFGEKKKKSKMVLNIGIILFAISFLIMAFSPNLFIFITGVVIFFVGFNMHEPIMQSLATKYIKANQRGTALGIFNAFGNLGTFLGGALGALLYVQYGLSELAIIVFISCVFWLIALRFLTDPNTLKNIYLDKSGVDVQKLLALNGIIECYTTNEHTIIKYNSDLISEKQIRDSLC